jgi:UDP-N-acetylmuramyl pentapeptide synthase
MFSWAPKMILRPDLPDRLKTWIGRHELWNIDVNFRLWPLLAPLAKAYRKTLAQQVRLVTVVGSLGKTTTARAVAAGLGLPENPRIGLNASSFLARALLRIPPWSRRAVIEVGIARKGEMRRYTDLLLPDIAVVTSIASDHNRSLENLQVTRREKCEMVRALPPSGWAVLNGDDPNVLWMRGVTPAHVTTFGLGEANDVRASRVALDWPHGTKFRLHAAGTTRELRVRLVGQHMVYSILAAVTVGLLEGLNLDQLIPPLEALSPTVGRLQPVQLDNGAIVLRDELKSSLETVERALDLLQEIPARRRIVVLGDLMEPTGGVGEVYRAVGARVARAATQAIFFGRNTKQPYKTGALRGGMPREAVVNAGKSLRKALDAIPTDLGPGDVVLVKGRSSQHLARVSLALMGRDVRCEISDCFARTIRCDDCKMLERGWGNHREDR